MHRVQRGDVLHNTGQRVLVLLTGHVFATAGKLLQFVPGWLLLAGQRVGLYRVSCGKLYGREPELELQPVRGRAVFVWERKLVPVLRGGQVQRRGRMLCLLQHD